MRKNLFAVFLFIPCLLFSDAAVNASEAKNFIWGVCGHPNVRQGYTDISIRIQLDLLAELGVEYYRIDWNDWGNFLFPNTLFYEASKRGIKILPVLFPPFTLEEGMDIKTVYKKAYDYACKWVSRYKKEVSCWELGNETELFALIRKGEKMKTGATWQWETPDGDLPEHYEENRYQLVRAMLLGLADGVWVADRKAKRIINTAGWFHYGFIKRLIDDRVPFEILAWHWDSGMGDISDVGGGFNLLEQIKSFEKPVWITEINRCNGTRDDNEQEQANYIEKAANQMREQGVIQAFFVYELLDEPYLSGENESYHGLVKLKQDEKNHWVLGLEKQAFETYRKIIELYKKE